MKNISKRTKIIFASAICAPFTDGGICADFASFLPRALKGKGADIKVVLPLYLQIQSGIKRKLNFVCAIDVYMPLSKLTTGIYSLKTYDIEYLFIENDYYFGRKGILGHYDDGERVAFFCKSAIETAKLYGAGLIHCADWHTALIPIYLKCEDSPIATVFSLCDVNTQGKFSVGIMESSLSLNKDCLRYVECEGNVNLLKGGIRCADAVTAPGPSYAKYIKQKDSELASELSNKKFEGYLWGIDCATYNPQTDKALPQNYSVNNLEGKPVCKAVMQRKLRFCVDKTVPLIVFWGKLNEERGAEILINAIPGLLKYDVQLAVIGRGDIDCENILLEYAKTYKGKMGVKITDDSKYQRKILAAADIALLPHMPLPDADDAAKALRYGAVCIAAKGVFSDRIVQGYNGFIFDNNSQKDIKEKISEAINLYCGDKNAWKELVLNAMKGDYTWSYAANKHIELYSTLL